MTRKSNSTIRLITAIAMVMALSLSLVIPAIAYPWSVGTKDVPAPSAITKKFDMPIGTVVPSSSTFTFTYTKEGIGTKTDETTKGTMPDIPATTITITAAELAAAGPANKTLIIEDKTTNIKSIFKESDDILKNVPANKWPGAGVYTYTVRETEGGVTMPNTGATKEGAFYSPARYKIEFWVEEVEDSQGQGTGVYFVKYVNAVIIEEFTDEYYDEGKPADGKVDPTPGSSTVTSYTTKEGFSGIIFTNRYWRSDGGGTETGDTALEIAKSLSGNDTDPERFNRYFEFKVTVIQPSVVDTDQTYTAYIFNSSNAKVTATENYDNYGAGGLISFPTDTERTFKLKDGERLVFIDLHVGATVKVSETAHPLYRPKYERTFAPAGTTAFTALEANTTWGFPRTDAPEDIGPHYLPEGKNVNKVNYINIRTNATPTGLDVDELPYLILIGLAVVGLVGYAAVKIRRRTHDDA